MHRGGNINQAHQSGQDQKYPATIDIRFDQRNSIDIIKDEALLKYQENAFLLGKIFSVEAQPSSSQQRTQASPNDLEGEFSDDDSFSEDSSIQNQDDYVLGQLLNQNRHNLAGGVNGSGVDSGKLFESDQEQMNDQDQEMEDAILEEENLASQTFKIDFKVLGQDEEGQLLLNQFKAIQNEQKSVVDAKRKQHEQMVREQKEFITLMSRIKTNNQLKGNNGIDELLRECQQAVLGQQNTNNGMKIMHPVFIELEKFTKTLGNSQQSLNQTANEDNLKPWSVENRDKIKVLQL
ncbi:UNKNOWN [Stylonychia lemnae]|uniref:Uncharacterized protein n=1 Tax=Stylonychia lemnae TaxID=5949 RepID=A0A078A4B8_STYLE|nr:UNKNOWN [Stylonychia lemnae]|eukprot:CDW76744.1 UNKNOWN [Stylonychia lemnae]